jgi:hypothetical protein
MDGMTFLIYLFYGAFFTFAMLLYTRSYILRGSGQTLPVASKKSAQTALLPFLALLFVSFVIFTVFRDGGVGIDYYSYKAFFDSAARATLSDYIKIQMAIGGEPLYSTVSFAVKRLTNNFLIFLFIINTVIFLTQATLFSKTKGFLVPFAFYLILFFPLIFESFNILRSCLAALIAIWGYIYLDKKNYFAAFLVFLAATMVHYTALFCFVVWAMCIICDKKNFRIKRFLFLIFLVTTVLFILISRLVDMVLIIKPVYSYHLEAGGGVAVKSMAFYVVVFIISLFYSKKLIAHNPLNRIMIIALGSILITIPLQTMMALVARMNLYAQCAVFFLVCEIFSTVKLTRRNLFPTMCVFLMIILLSLGWFYSHVTAVAVDYGIGNYKNMLFDSFFGEAL